jgi:hypothetical protein
MPLRVPEALARPRQIGPPNNRQSPTSAPFAAAFEAAATAEDAPLAPGRSIPDLAPEAHCGQA